MPMYMLALTVDRTRDLQIFSLTLSQLSYQGSHRIKDQPAPQRSPCHICAMMLC